MSQKIQPRPPRPDAVHPTTPDAAALAHDLRGVVRGEVRFDAGSCALYSTDGSNYRQVPIGVVVPRDADDVVATVEIARRYAAPVLPRGCGTSLAGQCCNVAVVIDMSKYMHGLVSLDADARRAEFQPGIILDDLRDAAEQHHLTFGPDPATHNRCTLGGMIGNNSCGVHALMGGKTDDNIEELDVLTYDGLRMRVGKASDDEIEAIVRAGGRRGEIYAGLRDLRDRYAGLIRSRYPDIPRRVSGYNLPRLLPERGFDVAKALVGSEGTCVTVLSATGRLIPSPPQRVLCVLGYPDVYGAAGDVPRILEYGPIGLEGIDDILVEDMRKKQLHPKDVQLLPDGAGWLLVEFGGDTKDEAQGRARAMMDALRKGSNPPSMKLYEDEREAERVWTVRESGLGATARVPLEPDTWTGWEDSAVLPDRLAGYLRDLRGLFDRFDYNGALYGHFGQGCVHTRINFDLITEDGIERYRAFIDRASDLVLSYGGSLSGEHGDGQSRGPFLEKMFGTELMQAFREFKAIWDPSGKMNPGKVVDAYSIDENLRLGTYYNPPQPDTHFKFPDDSGSFSRTTTRCVGVGKCRRLEGGVMCPSFKATREEMHSTRGRARLLFEMLEGNPLRDGWRDDAVREALDLCLACKGCKSDCPVNVDMATYKAEFLSHYYANRLRPRSAYALGLIYWWSGIAARIPAVANFASQAPLLNRIAKAVAGVSQQRELPAFASPTFKQSFAQRPPTPAGTHGSVVLWPDTFNNHFYPATARAAVDVLEHAGFRVDVPSESLCCGRPLYDYGMLDRAEGLLRQVLRALKPHIIAGTPIVVLEPSCLSVFRDELVNLFPNDHDALRLSKQSFSLGEFLERNAPDFEPPRLNGRALLQGHCHQKVLVGMQEDQRLLDMLGLEYDEPEPGCCGMAGAFGFESDHCDVSVTIGEQHLMPAVRASSDDTYVVADGFSCREQIRQLSDRRGLHIAEVLQMALEHEQPRGQQRPERLRERAQRPSGVMAPLALTAGAAAMAAGIALGLRRRGGRK